MKVVKPCAEVIAATPSMLSLIEIAARKCYLSEPKKEYNSLIEFQRVREEFIRDKIRRGHESILEHASVSVNIVCDRGVSHELVRHRLSSFSQESTRYCNYSGERFGEEIAFIQPFFFD